MAEGQQDMLVSDGPEVGAGSVVTGQAENIALDESSNEAAGIHN